MPILKMIINALDLALWLLRDARDEYSFDPQQYDSWRVSIRGIRDELKELNK